eukprot:g78065.t1
MSCRTCASCDACATTPGCTIVDCAALQAHASCTSHSKCEWLPTMSDCPGLSQKDCKDRSDCRWRAQVAYCEVKSITWECVGERYCEGTPTANSVDPVAGGSTGAPPASTAGPSSTTSTSTTTTTKSASSQSAASTYGNPMWGPGKVSAGLADMKSFEALIGDCYDRIQQPDEEGVDCGGRCPKDCPKLGHRFDEIAGLEDGRGFHIFLALCLLIFSFVFYYFARPWQQCRRPRFCCPGEKAQTPAAPAPEGSSRVQRSATQSVLRPAASPLPSP